MLNKYARTTVRQIMVWSWWRWLSLSLFLWWLAAVVLLFGVEFTKASIRLLLLLLLAVTLAKFSTERGPLAVHLCMKHHLHRRHFHTKQLSVGQGGKLSSNPMHNLCGDITWNYGSHGFQLKRLDFKRATVCKCDHNFKGMNKPLNIRI